MSTPSYNQFNYHYRPAKATERKIYVSILKEIYGVNVKEECTYIGMGSIYFQDFKLLHRELGISKMINIEKEIKDQARFRFNKPYSCISLRWGSTTDVLPKISWKGKKIIWLDYDSKIQKYFFDDIDIIFQKMEVNSFFMLSCNSKLDKYFDRSVMLHKEDDFKNDFEEFIPLDFSSEMMTNKNSPLLIKKMILDRITHNIMQRNITLNEDCKVKFVQLLFIVYQDGAPMITLGGQLIKKTESQNFNQHRLNGLPFVRKGNRPLDLKSPKLTVKELGLLNSFLPALKLDDKSVKFIPNDDRNLYLNTYRYYPNFVEVKE